MLSWKARKLAKLLQKLRTSVVVVEGKRDCSALLSLGFSRVELLQGRPVQLADRLAASKVLEAVVLTDFDRAGLVLESRTREALEAVGIVVRSDLRRDFKRFLGPRCIEDVVHSLKEFIQGCAQAGVDFSCLELRKELKEEIGV